MKNILVISPHPDDETLGCGGTLLKYGKHDNIFWLNITSLKNEDGFEFKKIKNRNDEIEKVNKYYGFKKYICLNFSTTKIDSVPMNKLISSISDVISGIEPEVLFIPYINDIHTDHQIIGSAILSSVKWFRYPSIKKVLMYETLSETNFNFGENQFSPNVFIDISNYVSNKIKIFKIYKSECGIHPFPRSEKSIRALATLRGSQSGYESAEAFQLIFERI